MKLPDLITVCGWCYAAERAAAGDIPSAAEAIGTMTLCPQHRKLMDQMNDRLSGIIIPDSRLRSEDGWPIAWPAQPEPPTPAIDTSRVLDWISQLSADPGGISLEAEIMAELRFQILPVSTAELAVRLGALARTYLRRDMVPSSEHTSYRLLWLSATGGVVLTRDHIRPHEADTLGPAKIGWQGIEHYALTMRRHEAYPDGSEWSGPWVTVTTTLPEENDHVRGTPAD